MFGQALARPLPQVPERPGQDRGSLVHVTVVRLCRGMLSPVDVAASASAAVHCWHVVLFPCPPHANRLRVNPYGRHIFPMSPCPHFASMCPSDRRPCAQVTTDVHSMCVSEPVTE